VIRSRSDKSPRRAETALWNVPGIELAVVKHHAVRHGVDVVPDNSLSSRDGRRIRGERLHAVDGDDVDRDGISWRVRRLGGCRWRRAAVARTRPNTQHEWHKAHRR